MLETDVYEARVNGSGEEYSVINGSLDDSLQWQIFLETRCQVALSVDRYVTPVWYVIGATGNALSALVWLQRRMRSNNSSAVYLASLSISDLVFLALHVCMELQYAWFVPTLRFPVFCEAYFLFYAATQYLSPALVLGFTVDRYIAVCHPFRKESLCRAKRAVKTVATTVAACFSLGAVQAYFWTYDRRTDECRVRPDVTSDDGSMSLWSAWAWGSEGVVFLVVPIVILVVNVLVIRELRSLNRKRVSMATVSSSSSKSTSGSGCAATTAMLLSVSFYVIVTSLPATLVYVLEARFTYRAHGGTAEDRYVTYLTTRRIVEELCLSHYACNFFVYLVTGEQFRKALTRICGCSRGRGGGGGGRNQELKRGPSGALQGSRRTFCPGETEGRLSGDTSRPTLQRLWVSSDV